MRTGEHIMKKIISIALTLILALGLLFAAVLPAAAESGENPFAPPANLNELSQAEQLEYFNLVVNRVRNDRPGFQQMQRMKIEEMLLSGAIAAVQPIINDLINQLMPGHWESQFISSGQSNIGQFMSNNANASDLCPHDITSISATQEGDFWVIDVRIQEEANPSRGLGSANGRIAWIMTREEIIADITSVGPITANPANASVLYYNGYARVIVNPEGKVVSAANGYGVHAYANDVRIAIISANIAVSQTSSWRYSQFSWASGGVPSIGDPTPSPLPLDPPWHFNLPAWLQFILRWFFFGWLWM